MPPSEPPISERAKGPVRNLNIPNDRIASLISETFGNRFVDCVYNALGEPCRMRVGAASHKINNKCGRERFIDLATLISYGPLSENPRKVASVKDVLILTSCLAPFARLRLYSRCESGKRRTVLLAIEGPSNSTMRHDYPPRAGSPSR